MMGSFLLLVELQRSAFPGFAQRNRRPPFGGERKRIANRQVRGAHNTKSTPHGVLFVLHSLFAI